MKKAFAVVLAMVFVACAGLAESIDFTEMSTEELINMEAMIQDELVNRGEEYQAPIYSGVYVGGKSIRTGTFIITTENYSQCAYGLYADEESFEEGAYIIYEYFHSPSVVITVDEGMVLELRLEDADSAYISNQKLAWMP